MTHLFTSGYEGESIKSFINKLKASDIEAIVDIRENPFSRKPGFSQKALRDNLSHAGIEYYHYQELGTPRPLRKFLEENQDYPSFFEQYKSYLPEYRDSVDDIVDLGDDKKICLLCFEKSHHFCHRKVVADYIREYAGKNIELIHL